MVVVSTQNVTVHVKLTKPGMYRLPPYTIPHLALKSVGLLE